MTNVPFVVAFIAQMLAFNLLPMRRRCPVSAAIVEREA
jgi:hypothetical protein